MNDKTRFLIVAVILIFALSSITPTLAQDEELESPTTGPEGLSLEEVPPESHRIAAQLVGELAGTEDDVPEWDVDSARLGPVVVPFYRFDVEGPAYYEFQVVTGSIDEPQPAGSILISTGPHDFPIVEWNSAGVPVSWHLLARSDGEATTFYKLAQVYFVAENADGERVAEIGTRIMRISGMEMEWLDEERELNSVRVVPVELPEDLEADLEEMPEIEYTIEETGPEPYPIEYTEWESWDELKDGYAESQAVLNESLRRAAARDWEVTALVHEFGEGLIVEQTHRVMLLFPGAEFELLAETEDVVAVEMLERNDLPAILEITALSPGDAHISITYPEGQQVDLRFFVMDPDDAPEPATSAAPTQTDLILTFYTPDQATTASQRGTIIDTGWITQWAGTGKVSTEWDQRDYYKFTLSTSGCDSGCGPTAWANLIGWADRQAALGHWYWQGRHGLYRANGGVGTDVRAPRDMDQGVRNMVLEIRGHVGTNCSGWTLFRTMSGVWYYLKSRSFTWPLTYWNDFGTSYGLYLEARDSIADLQTPSVIGRDGHINVAFAHRVRLIFFRDSAGNYYILDILREFKVNQGWDPGDDDLEWIAADTEFSGRLVTLPGIPDQ